MKAVMLRERSLMGVEDVQIKLGQITRIIGKNGTGKTSVLEGVKALLGEGNDATLLRRGETDAEVVLVLDNGKEFRAKVGQNGKIRRSVTPSEGGTARSAIDRLVDSISLNPVEFLTAKPERQVELLLETLPMTVTREQIKAATGLDNVNVDGHALTVIDKVADQIYEDRTGINRLAKEKRATVNELLATLPNQSEYEDYTSLLSDLDKAKDGAIIEKERQTAAVDITLEGAKSDAEKDYQRKLSAAKEDADKRIDAIRKELSETDLRLRREKDKVISQVEEEAADYKRQIAAAADPQVDELRKQIAETQSRANRYAELERTRKRIRELTAEAEKSEAESQQKTNALGALDRLKLNLLKDFPIPDLTIEAGKILIDGIPFARVNTARKADIVFDFCTFRAGGLAFIVLDGAESLDDDTLNAIERKAAEREVQVLLTRVIKNDAEMKQYIEDGATQISQSAGGPLFVQTLEPSEVLG
jgi:ABC-type cobalamin/Fe3+-siderophores transport system ATPase subunit